MIIKISRNWNDMVSEARLVIALPDGAPKERKEQVTFYEEVCYEASKILLGIIIDSTPMPSGAFMRIEYMGSVHDIRCETDMRDGDAPEQEVTALGRAVAGAVIGVVGTYFDEHGWDRRRD